MYTINVNYKCKLERKALRKYDVLIAIRSAKPFHKCSFWMLNKCEFT